MWKFAGGQRTGVKLEKPRNWSCAQQVSRFKRRTTLLYSLSGLLRSDEASLNLSSTRLAPVSRGMKWVNSMFAGNKEIKHPPPRAWGIEVTLQPICLHPYRDWIVDPTASKLCVQREGVPEVLQGNHHSHRKAVLQKP